MNIRNLIGVLALTANVCLAQAQQKTFTIAVLPDTQMYTEEKGERNRTILKVRPSGSLIIIKRKISSM